MDASESKKSSKEIIIYLSNQFPNCFTIEGNAKPLKIGIFQDIVERLADDEHFSKTKLRVALRLYTASWRYLYSLKEGANRVDLDGNSCEIITSEQALHAQEQLKESKEKAKAKRTAENKEKPSLPRSGKTHKPKSFNSAKKQTNAPRLCKVEIAQLNVGDSVKIMLGSRPVPATISNLEKEHVKVKISSGMELMVTVDHILI